MFTSRTDTMKFYDILKRYNGFCSVINTPHSLAKSCGISVKISNNQLELSKQIVGHNSFPSFKGIYEINMSESVNIPRRIY